MYDTSMYIYIYIERERDDMCLFSDILHTTYKLYIQHMTYMLKRQKDGGRREGQVRALDPPGGPDLCICLNAH